MNRIVLHWTGGSYTPSSLDKEHYHFLIDGDGVVHEGKYPVEANRSTSDADGYAAHTRSLNTGSIGVALCAMAGATTSDFGQFPIKNDQWSSLFLLLSKLCDQYSIPVTRETVLSHAEVGPTLGVKQRGKWDISVFPFTNEIGNPVTVGEVIRSHVRISTTQQESRPEPSLSCTECGKVMASSSDSVAMSKKNNLCRKALLKILSAYFEDESLVDEVREHVIEGLVMVYQDDYLLDKDGIPGPDTWKALESTSRLYRISNLFDEQ